MKKYSPNRSILFMPLFVFGSFAASFSIPVQLDGSVQTVNKDYSIHKSRVLVRSVSLPTRANLDLALYADNVMLFDSSTFEVVAPEKKLSLKKLNFDKTLSSVESKFSSTGVAKSKGAISLHWAALKDFLMKWDFEKSQIIVEKLSSISEEKFGNDDAALPLMEIARFYLKPAKKSYEVWIRIDVKPWAAPIYPFLKDENNDGFPEFYGRVNKDIISNDILDAITGDYISKPLTREEILTWANELASFWYPTYNTDIYRISSEMWPDNGVDSEVKSTIGDFSVKKPMVVIKGKPFGYELYNVLLVDGMEGDVEQSASGSGKALRHGIDTSVPQMIQAKRNALEEELKTLGNGSYEAWAISFNPYIKSIQGVLKSEPEEIKGFVGKEDFLFFRNTFNYMQGGDIARQADGKNPIPSIVACKKALEEIGVDFLFVPVPVKADVYPEMVSALPKGAKGPFVNPYGRKFLKDLLDAGVEVVDLLPEFLAEKKKDCKNCEPLYQKQDTHWGTRGLEVAARIISERIKGYSWFDELSTSEFSVRDSVFTAQGDIVARLKPALQQKYPPARLLGKMVIDSDGKPYQDSKNSPVLLITDSFGGVYQRTGCKSAGVSSHIAKNIGSPVQLQVSYGGGPLLVGQLKRMGLDAIAGKRVVIWMMVARDLYNYHENWEILERIEPKIEED